MSPENPDRNDADRTELNIDRLLEAGGPAPKMPGELKARIRERLAESGHRGAVGQRGPRRWAGWTMAAAAVLAFLLFSFWPMGSQAAISWSDVLDRLETVKTLRAFTRTEVTHAGGGVTTQRATIHFKDPGLSRTELFAPGTDDATAAAPPLSITVIHRGPAGAEQLTLHPRVDRAERVSHVFRADDDEAPTRPIIDLASESWKRLREIAGEETRRIGERIVEGLPATGFEVPARDFFPSTGAATVDGTVRVWAGSEDATPLLVELRFTDRTGRGVITEISGIEWNVPLDDELFSLVVPVDWQLERTRIETVEYTRTGLAPHVTITVAPDDGEPLIDASGVASLVGAEQVTRRRQDIPGQLRVTLELKPAAAEILHAFRSANPDRLLVLDFNGELSVVPRLEETHPNRISFDLSLLGLELEELERACFRRRP